MASQMWLTISAGVGVALLAALAETLHARRVRRVGRLAFGPQERSRPWTRVVAPLRSICLGAFAWGLATLVLATSQWSQGAPPPVGSHTRHVVFVADMSPSMYLKDAGPKRDQMRRARMADVVEGVLDRVSGDVSFSIIGFYTDALPVVLQARDRMVVRNVLDGMPLVYAMGVGQTDLGSSISKAMEVIKPFPKSSVTLFICTDGDTVALAQPLYAPPSVERTTVLGVGDTERGTFIDGHQSRQDVTVLASIASALGAEYINVNDRHVPTSAMSGLVVDSGAGGGMNLKEMAIWAMALAASILAFIPVAQQYAGTGWRLHLPSAAPGRRVEGP